MNDIFMVLNTRWSNLIESQITAKEVAAKATMEEGGRYRQNVMISGMNGTTNSRTHLKTNRIRIFVILIQPAPRQPHLVLPHVLTGRH
jgi:hypothetical protein